MESRVHLVLRSDFSQKKGPTIGRGCFPRGPNLQITIKDQRGGVALLYYFTSPKTLGFHTREKPLLVSEVAIFDKPYDGVKCR